MRPHGSQLTKKEWTQGMSRRFGLGQEHLFLPMRHCRDVQASYKDIEDSTRSAAMQDCRCTAITIRLAIQTCSRSSSRVTSKVAIHFVRTQTDESSNPLLSAHCVARTGATIGIYCFSTDAPDTDDGALSMGMSGLRDTLTLWPIKFKRQNG